MASAALFKMNEVYILDLDGLIISKQLPNEVEEISEWRQKYPEQEQAIRKYIQDVKEYIKNNKSKE